MKTRLRKVTAATVRRAEEQFRAFVIAQPPGATVEWSDIDSWVNASFAAFYRDDDEDHGDDRIIVACMILAEQLAPQGWLAFQDGRPRGDDGDGNNYYYRTGFKP
jgi:hypothetical protein